MRMSDPGEFALFLAIGGTFVTLFLGPIGQAIASGCAARRPPPGRD
jgi:hypothetical protein